MEPSRWAPLVLLLALGASGVRGETLQVGGSWQLSGRNGRGPYEGTVTLVQDRQGHVRGELALVYQTWSWLRFRYVPSSRVETAQLEVRVEGSELVGSRRADGITGVLEGSIPVRYRIATRASADARGSRIESISGTYGHARERLFEHRPADLSSEQRNRELALIRAALEEATRGLVYVSESDHDFQVLVRPGAADYVRTVEDWKRELSIPAYRFGQAGTLEGTLGKRAAHRAGESPEEAARADRYAALIRALQERLQEVRVFRVAGPDATLNGDGDLVGAIDVYVVGRTPSGDLVALRTVSVET